MTITEPLNLSKNFTRWPLTTDAISAQFSYDALFRHIRKQSHVKKHKDLMFRKEQSAGTRSATEANICQSTSCSKTLSGIHLFWYSLISEQLAALCRERSSFAKTMRGCRKAQEYIISPVGDIFIYTYDGSLFQKRHGEKMATFMRLTSLPFS